MKITYTILRGMCTALLLLCCTHSLYSQGWWGDAKYTGKPWVRNSSRPMPPSSALNGKHISLWASHGKYFCKSTNKWEWQRPNMFCTNEDLFTQTIVVPYLIPMLENAGAVVFTPRERDWQTEEVIVDNDGNGYTEGFGSVSTNTNNVSSGASGRSRWTTCKSFGFATPSVSITDGYNPFEHGTVRQIKATSSADADFATYLPTFKKSGRYAVYVSYATLPNSADDVTYTVYHEGQQTVFHVNQQMGGSTWVYLGTFYFSQGDNAYNRVVVSSRSTSKGIITTDAVRFGGGMGNVARDNTGLIANRMFLQALDTLVQNMDLSVNLPADTLVDSIHFAARIDSVKAIMRDSIKIAWRDSVKALMASAKPRISGLPRCLEGARYYAQWAGVPDSIYSVYHSQEDYKDDINVRSLMTNWLAGGSPYVPDRPGKKVPIDLSLAFHSDAGYNKDMKSIFGSLAICTTHYGDSLLATGLVRSYSKDLAQKLLDQSKKDLVATYGNWTWRDLYDRNYSETRLPAMPSAIFEMLSHQSFPDMKMAQDPNFRFTLARSIYKTILRYEAEAHGEDAVVEPLPPICFSTQCDKSGNVTLSWQAQKDSLEESALPTSYNIYTAVGGFDFDNGKNIRQTHSTIHLSPDVTYRFRVTAVNSGGESFPSEELSVVWHGASAKNILVVNGFTRLSSPAVIDEPTRKGFDMNDDPGVTYGLTAGWCGAQKVFSTATAGRTGAGTFSYSGNEMVGRFVAGNSFNYTSEHAFAIASANKYNIVSCSRAAVEQGIVNLNDYACVDLILGNQKDDGHSLIYYKTFTPALREKLSAYKNNGKGALLVSGSYLGSDMKGGITTQVPDSMLNDSILQVIEYEREHCDSTFISDLLHCNFYGTVTSANQIVNGLQQSINITSTLNPDHYATTKSDVLLPVTSYLAPSDTFTAMQYSDGQSAAIANKNGFRTFTMGFPLECISNSSQRSVIMRGILQFLLE